MKQKIVIKLPTNGNKYPSKALKIAVGVKGVESAALQGQDKNQIEVIGEGINSVELTELLRKYLAYSELGLVSYLRNNEEYAELVSVTPVEEKKEPAAAGGEENKTDIVHPPVYWSIGYPYGGYFDPYYRG